MDKQEQFYLDVQNLIFDMSRFKVGTDIKDSISRLEQLESRKSDLAARANELKIPFRFEEMFSTTVDEGFDDVAWDSSSIDC